MIDNGPKDSHGKTSGLDHVRKFYYSLCITNLRMCSAKKMANNELGFHYISYYSTFKCISPHIKTSFPYITEVPIIILYINSQSPRKLNFTIGSVFNPLSWSMSDEDFYSEESYEFEFEEDEEGSIIEEDKEEEEYGIVCILCHSSRIIL